MLFLKRRQRPFLEARAFLSVDGAEDHAVEDEFEIQRAFLDPYLEVTRLLREAANIEHALMLQYLHASYSVRERYFSTLAGAPANDSSSLLGLAVQEMKHLSLVNRLLVEIGGAPNIDRQDFPIRNDIYPFELSLEPLTLESLAKYLAAEAPHGALDPATAPDAAERSYRERVHALLGTASVNQLGSLYRTIIARLQEANVARPGLVADLGRWIADLERVIGEGEQGHYALLKSVFLGEHPAFAGVADPWSSPGGPDYPSRPFEVDRSAFEGAPNAIADDLSRRLAWLGNLHYWTILALLNFGHSLGRPDLVGQAKAHMLSCLHGLSRHLARRDVGMPFDALGLNFDMGRDADRSRDYLRALMREIIAVQQDIDTGLPPVTLYRKTLAQATFDMIGG